MVAKERLQGSWKYMAGIYGIIFGLILFYGLFSHIPILGISLSVVCGSCLLFSSIRMNRKLHHDEKVQLYSVDLVIVLNVSGYLYGLEFVSLYGLAYLLFLGSLNYTAIAWPSIF